jgi:hypothetical protein
MEILIIIGAIILYFVFKNINKGGGYKSYQTRSNTDSIDYDNSPTVDYQAADPVISLIGQQITMAGGVNNLPQKAKDEYSLGYIAGMLDASLSGLGVDSFDTMMATLSFTFQNLFGEEGKELFMKSFKLLQNDNAIYNKALSDGGTEFMRFMGKHINAPMGWYKYIKGI